MKQVIHLINESWNLFFGERAASAARLMPDF